MKKTVIGIGLGTIAGILALIPMLIQKMPINACLSSFTMWLVIGLFVSLIDMKINNVIEGVLIALLVFIPNSMITDWNKPGSILPVIALTVILGGIIGYFVNKYADKS